MIVQEERDGRKGLVRKRIDSIWSSVWLAGTITFIRGNKYLLTPNLPPDYASYRSVKYDRRHNS